MTKNILKPKISEEKLWNQKLMRKKNSEEEKILEPKFRGKKFWS